MSATEASSFLRGEDVPIEDLDSAYKTPHAQ